MDDIATHAYITYLHSMIEKYQEALGLKSQLVDVLESYVKNLSDVILVQHKMINAYEGLIGAPVSKLDIEGLDG